MAIRGRPRTFDRAEALRRAMEVFRARGYDGATLEELQSAMGGIAPPSFYAAFGSKDQLFREAVELYRSIMSECVMRALDRPTAREGIDALLRAVIEQFCSGEAPHGCLIVLGAINCTRANKEAHDLLQTLRQQGPHIIRERLARGVAEGDLPGGAPVADMVSFYTTVLHGLAVRARDGVSRHALLAAAEAAMAAWEPLTGRPRRAPRRTTSTRLPRRRAH